MMKHSKLLLLLTALALVLALAGCDKDDGGEQQSTTQPNPWSGEYLTPPEDHPDYSQDETGNPGDDDVIDDFNYPYEPDTPAPAPHEGTFVSDYGTMTFNGDGESVTIDFNEDLAQRLGLPAGEQEATYVFLTGDLPPHGYIDIRYDVAMNFELTVGKGDDAVSVMVDIGQYEDGHFYTGTDCTTAERITFFVDDANGDWEPIDFLKS